MRPAAMLLLLVPGCQLVLGFEEFEAGRPASAVGGGGLGGAGGASGAGAGAVAGGGTSSGNGNGGSGANADAGGSEPCGHAMAPDDMIGARISDGSCIWIDAREVSQQAYETFVRNLTDLAPYIEAPCQWKTSFEQGCANDAGGADPSLPAACVDWCDARAYCMSLGRTLCGESTSPQRSAWQDVCSENGTNTYVYGSSYEPNLCVGRDNASFGCPGPCGPAPSGANTNCRTASGIFDLTGNIAEWVDECLADVGATDQCTFRGGSFASGASELACTSAKSGMRQMRAASVGFRCCWRPPA